MEKKDIKKLVIVFVAFLFLAMLYDGAQGELTQEGSIPLNDLGEDEKEVSLVVGLDGSTEEYEYLLSLEAVKPTEEQASEYFAKAIQEIEEDFADFEETIPTRETYQDGIVKARWSTIQEGLIVNASVTLQCGEYEQIYQFSFELKEEVLTEQEELLGAIDKFIETQMQQEGVKELYLPKEINGIKLHWREKKESVSLSVVILEGVAIGFLLVILRQKKEHKKREWIQKLEKDYPDIVGQLTLLLGAGMNIRQAWNKIAMRYFDKRQKEQIEKKPAYEEILLMNRRIQEGENEKAAYQKFANEINCMSYHRLIRLLIGNLEKGNGGLCERLEQECRQAYDQRITQAKKLGEEASTRMLLPLMLMMIIVMAIVMMPAVISFMR